MLWTHAVEDMTYKRDMVATEHRRCEGMRENWLFITARITPKVQPIAASTR